MTALAGEKRGREGGKLADAGDEEELDGGSVGGGGAGGLAVRVRARVRARVRVAVRVTVS